MLSFLSPLFLIGAAAAAVPIVLHLLKREPEARVKFAAVKLLKRAPVEHTEKHRLRELLLLALRVAALVLVAVAFARPFMPSGQAATAAVTVVALDTSYSMSAPGRFERARALARDRVNAAASGEQVGVVLFSDTAGIAAKPSADRVLARAAIDEAQAGYGATRYRSALSASVQALAGRRGTIVVVTDLQENGWDAGDRASVPDSVRVEIADVGALPPNVAVTAVRLLRDRVVATLHNAGPRPRDVKAHLTIDGRAAGDAAASLGPGQSADVTFAGAPRGTTAAVSVDDPEGIAADNVRYAALDAAVRPGVLIVGGSGDLSRDAFYVQHALATGEPAGRGYEVTAISGADLSSGRGASTSATMEARLASQAAVLVLSTRGLERRGRELLAGYVRGGGGLFVAAGPDVDGVVAADLLGGAATLTIGNDPATHVDAQALAPIDPRHPVFRTFVGTSATLALVTFRNAARIDGADCQTLARFTSGAPALLECAAGAGRAVVFASDLDNRWNDFPKHASFVPFLHETIKYLAASRATDSDYVVGDVPPGVPPTPGVHAVAGPSGSRRVTVNVDPREGDPARMSADDFQSAVTHLTAPDPAGGRAEARQREDDQHLWQYVLALMVVALAVEGIVASRTA